MTSIQEELDKIVQEAAITTHFQPIFDLRDHTIFAFEALSRGPQNSLLHRPDELFTAARYWNRLAEIDFLCRHQAIENFVRLGLPGRLSINIDPHVLMDTAFRKGRTLSMLQEFGLADGRIILELTEHTRTEQYTELRKAVHHYRDEGFTIAIDDLGAGYSNLRLLAELEPDFLKLDKFFISQVQHNVKAQDFIRLIVDLAKRVNCQIIAEGIEAQEELAFLARAGIEYAQGYLLGRPSPEPLTSLPAPLQQLFSPVHTVPGQRPQPLPNDEETVASLRIHPIPPCAPDTPLPAILERFKRDPRLRAIPVVKERNVLGLLTRDRILEEFASQYGHQLYRKRCAAEKMEQTPLVVSIHDSLTEVSRLVTRRVDEMLYTPFIVCNHQGYLGMVSVRSLLEKITEIQILQARQCNPLTGLPGNLCIQKKTQELLKAHRFFVVCHLDIDHFKAFNDAYSYERGDQMIQLVAATLRECAHRDDFIGHIGGDDFVFIATDDQWQQRIERCLALLDQRFPELYDLSARQQGFIEAENRNGVRQRFPLASISVAALPCPPNAFASHLEVSEILAELKHQAKRKAGTSLVIERRMHSATQG